MKYIMPAHDPNNRECQKNICEMCEPQTHDPCTCPQQLDKENTCTHMEHPSHLCPQQPAVEGWISEIEKRFAPNEDVAHDFDEVIDFIRSIITKAKEEEREEWKRAYASARDDGRREMVWLAEEHYWDSLEKDKDIILSHLRSLLPTGDKTTDHA